MQDMIGFVLILENLYPYHKSDIYVFLKYLLKTFFFFATKKSENKDLTKRRKQNNGIFISYHH